MGSTNSHHDFLASIKVGDRVRIFKKSHYPKIMTRSAHTVTDMRVFDGNLELLLTRIHLQRRREVSVWVPANQIERVLDQNLKVLDKCENHQIPYQEAKSRQYCLVCSIKSDCKWINSHQPIDRVSDFIDPSTDHSCKNCMLDRNGIHED